MYSDGTQQRPASLNTLSADPDNATTKTSRQVNPGHRLMSHVHQYITMSVIRLPIFIYQRRVEFTIEYLLTQQHSTMRLQRWVKHCYSSTQTPPPPPGPTPPAPYSLHASYVYTLSDYEFILLRSVRNSKQNNLVFCFLLHWQII